MRSTVSLGAAFVVAATVAAGAWSGGAGVAAAGGAAGGPHWASAAKATVHPGVRVEMADVTCLAGFVLTDGSRVYIAVPATCSGAGQVPNEHCDAGQVPVGVKVTIQGAKHPGTLAYSSFTQMELRGEHRQNVCANNSLSLVRLDPRDVGRTNPSVPALGGPTGLSKDQPAFPDQLMTYLSTPTSAQAVSSDANGWSHSIVVDGEVNALDAGAPVLTNKGQALGMVTIVPQQGGPGETVVSNLGRELRDMHRVTRFADVHLATGTQPYGPSSVPLSA